MNLNKATDPCISLLRHYLQKIIIDDVIFIWNRFNIIHLTNIYGIES